MSGQNPTLTVYVGPMFSSKTTKMLSALERYELQKKRVMVFKPAIDDRYSDAEVVSHSGWKHPAITVKEAPDILEAIAEAEDPPDVIAVDEAFMIKGVAEVLTWLYRTGITIVVSSLDLGYQGKAFHEVEKLLPWATHIEKCSAICSECGRDAYYTHRKHVISDEEIQVGGAEHYEPRCFRHHLAIDNRPDIHKQ